MVCEACQKVLLRRSKVLQRGHDWIELAHHKDVESLRKAAEDDQCILCYRLWRNVGEQMTSGVAMSKHAECRYATRAIIRYATHPLRFVKIVHILYGPPPHVVEFEFSGALSNFNLDIRQNDIRARLRESPVLFQDLAGVDTAFSHTLPIVQRWLQQCCAHHATCNDDYDRADWNPTRLLDLGTTEDGELCLVDQTSLHGPVPYITLSHRWGQADFAKLIKSTEEHLMTGLRLSELPLTFRHACQVTRALGHRYLWIDSLCIKQDDLSDWAHESALMHKVYRHGELNLSATSANDCHDGLFRHRDYAARGFEEVNFRRTGLLGNVQPYGIMHEDFWEQNVQTAPLNRRGWVLQERILSKRVLHFGQTQLLWECRELHAAESFPDGLPTKCGFNLQRMKDLNRTDLGGSLMESAWDQKYRAHRQWSPIVSKYSACSLTKSDDKLIAIMGIAKHMSMLLNDEYVAGMWKRFLASELTWHIVDLNRHNNRRPATYRAPTWSWLSLDATIQPAEPSEEDLRANIKDILLELATEDSFGTLLGGKLILEGVVRRAEVTTHKPDTIVQTPWRVHLLDRPWCDDDVYCSRTFVDVEPDDNFEHDNASGSLFGIEMQIRSHHYLDLLLLRCEDREAGVFSRVGLCELWEHSRWALVQDQQHPHTLPCISYDASKGLHTICIV